MPTRFHLYFLSGLLLSIVSYLVYSPGISGPFLFDDITSITTNSKLQVTNLTHYELSNATWSGYAGPLKRPVAMLSFALNYYFSDGYISSVFKITNIVIHSINAILVYILSIQLFTRASLIGKNLNPQYLWGAFAVSLLWAIHPINLTSVLYIVQRMTSLSTLFSLSCIIMYLCARNRYLNSPLSWRIGFFLLGSLCSLTLALFSKENAILIPLIILLIELLLYSNKKPWTSLQELPKRLKLLCWALVIITALLSLFWSINYASGGFSGRPFTMLERLLTESRVLCFYISLIFIPRINAFGLFHDDIPLSSSLFEPWTTIVSILFILGALLTAFHFRKKNPLFSLGIGWFFIGHLLESTYFPLEIAHEHRNNLPSIGLILAATSLLSTINLKNKTLASCLVVTLLIMGSTTWLRATQWSSAYTQALYEISHHPNSAAAQTVFSNVAHKTGHTEAAITAIKKAMELSPDEIALPMYYQHMLATSQLPITNSIQKDTLNIIKDNKITPSAQLALSQLSDCLPLDSCKAIRKNYLEWVDEIIKKHPRMAYYYLFKGKALLALGEEIQALNTFQNAFDMDEKFLHPLFEIADIFIKKGDTTNSLRVINWLKEANKKATIPRDNEINQLEKNFSSMKLKLKTQKISQIDFSTISQE